MKSLRGIFLISLIAGAVGGCMRPGDKIPPSPTEMARAQKINIYQLIVRLFGNTNTTNRVYGTIDENGSGKFEQINDAALQSLKALGITHIWYTGVIEHAVLTDYTRYGIPLDDADVVKGRAGSPYAIKDYYDVDPDLAVDVPNRMLEFERLIDRTHRNGLKAIIDFVPNHVARNYVGDARPEGTENLGQGDDVSKAFSTANNFYYLPGKSFVVPKGYEPLGDFPFPTKDGKFAENPARATGNNIFSASPSVNDWFETVKLNYGVDLQNGGRRNFDPIPDTWLRMRDILLFWAAKGVDGFRCDMAEMVPVEFWRWVIPQVKSVNEHIIFIAEIYQPKLYKAYLDSARFDMLYDKVQLYDTLRLMINGKVKSPSVARVLRANQTYNPHLIHFLENHDEQRVASPFFAGDPWKALPGMTISALADGGPVMIFFGQEIGEPGDGVTGFKGDDGRTTHFDYWGVKEHQKWLNGGKFDGGLLSDDQKALRQSYGDLLQLARDNPAISQGEFFDLTDANVAAGGMSGSVVVFARSLGEEHLVIVAGFGEKAERITVKLSPEVVRAFGLHSGTSYIGRDLLRSGTDIGLTPGWTFEMDVQPFSSTILKIK